MKNEKMKFNFLTLMLWLPMVSFSGGILTHSGKEEKSLINGEPFIKTAKSIDVTFRADKVIEIAYASVEGGKEAQLGEEYMPKIMPIAARYGGKILGSFQVNAVTGGEIQPQMVTIFEWPSVKAHDRLLEDPEARKLFPIRDEALTFIKLAYYTVDKDVTVTFRSDKTYEFFNAWFTPVAEHSLSEYSEKSKKPKLRYGPPKFVVSLKPVKNLPEADYILKPSSSGIVEWNHTSDFYGLIADPEFKKVRPLLEKSVSRLDMLHTKMIFPL